MIVSNIMSNTYRFDIRHERTHKYVLVNFQSEQVCMSGDECSSVLITNANVRLRTIRELKASVK